MTPGRQALQRMLRWTLSATAVLAGLGPGLGPAIHAAPAGAQVAR